MTGIKNLDQWKSSLIDIPFQSSWLLDFMGAQRTKAFWEIWITFLLCLRTGKISLLRDVAHWPVTVDSNMAAIVTYVVLRPNQPLFHGLFLYNSDLVGWFRKRKKKLTFTFDPWHHSACNNELIQSTPFTIVKLYKAHHLQETNHQKVSGNKITSSWVEIVFIHLLAFSQNASFPLICKGKSGHTIAYCSFSWWVLSSSTRDSSPEPQ